MIAHRLGHTTLQYASTVAQSPSPASAVHPASPGPHLPPARARASKGVPGARSHSHSLESQKLNIFLYARKVQVPAATDFISIGVVKRFWGNLLVPVSTPPHGMVGAWAAAHAATAHARAGQIHMQPKVMECVGSAFARAFQSRANRLVWWGFERVTPSYTFFTPGLRGGGASRAFASRAFGCPVPCRAKTCRRRHPAG